MPINCGLPMSLTSLCPMLNAKRVVTFRTLQQQYGDGYVNRRQDGLNPVNITWNVSTPPMSIADCQALEAELIANGAKSFTWTEPHSSTPASWILDPVEWDWNYQTGELASLSFTLRRWYS